jgi:hypothetical protein
MVTALFLVISFVGQGQLESPNEPISRILYLYYYPDARHVVEVLRGHSFDEPTAPMANLDERIEQTKVDRAQAERRLEAIAARDLPTNSTNQIINQLTGRSTEPAPADEATAAGLRAREAILEQRRFEAITVGQEQILMPGDPSASDPASRVTISVVGKGMIHLQGPAKGVHRLARMVHEIDRPVGRVKVGLHIIQLELPDGEEVERVHDLVEQHIRHARQLTTRSMELFRQSFDRAIESRKKPGDHPQCPVGVFCPRFVDELARCKHASNHEAAESLASSLRSLDLLGVLYVTSLAGDDFRKEVWERFDELVESEIIKMDYEYLEGLFKAAQEDPWFKGMYRGSCPECKGVLKPTLMTSASRREIRFTNLERLLERQECGVGMNSVQTATVALLETAQNRFEAESNVASLKADQQLMIQIAWHRQGAAGPTLRNPLEEFTLDRTIDQSESEIVDLDEQLRSAVATVDSHLTQLAVAMEEDFANQFYKRAMRHIRQASEHWNVRMGQVESTSIVTGDRISARVSPGQTVQLDLPDRPILAKELLDSFEVLASETQGVAQRLAARSAANAVGPAGTLLADAVGINRVGDQLDRLAPLPRNYRVDAGNEVEITPIIQPDGQSISYRLHYPYSTQISSPAGSGEPPRVVKHFVDTQVQCNNYEMHEVSRFRIGVQASKASRGVPVLQDIPLAGRLFKTRPTRSESVRETMILADAVIYPSILSVTGTNWLIPRSSSEAVLRDERQTELQARLLQQSRDRLDRLVKAELQEASEMPTSDPLASGAETDPANTTPTDVQWHRSPPSTDRIERMAARHLPVR